MFDYGLELDLHLAMGVLTRNHIFLVNLRGPVALSFVFVVQRLQRYEERPANGFNMAIIGLISIFSTSFSRRAYMGPSRFPIFFN